MNTYIYIYIYICIYLCALENALLFPNNSDNSVGTFALKGPRLNNPTKEDVTPRMLTSFVKIRLGRKTLT